jgi:hypothetical protein
VIIVLAFGLPSLFDQVMKLRDTIVKEVQEQLQKREQPPKQP